MYDIRCTVYIVHYIQYVMFTVHYSHCMAHIVPQFSFSCRHCYGILLRSWRGRDGVISRSRCIVVTKDYTVYAVLPSTPIVMVSWSAGVKQTRAIENRHYSSESSATHALRCAPTHAQSSYYVIIVVQVRRVISK